MGRYTMQTRQHGDEGNRIESKDPCRAERADEKSAQSRTNGPCEIETDAVKRNCGRCLVTGHQILKQGLPARQMNRGTEPEQQQQE